MRLSGPVIAIGAVAVAGAIGIGALAATGTLGDLMTADDVPLEPLVPPEDEEGGNGDGGNEEVEPEPLVLPTNPAGGQLAAAYRLEITNTYTAAHDVAIAADQQAGSEALAGDIVFVEGDRYEGTGILTARLSQDVSGLLGYRCTVTWAGRQTVELVGIVRGAETLGGAEFASAAPDTPYIALYATEPLGYADWSDPDNDCGGVTSEYVPFSYTGSAIQGSAIGGSVPRAPSPGSGTLEERFSYEGPGIFGDIAYEWVFRLTPISPEEAEEADVVRGVPLPSPTPGAGGTYAVDIGGGSQAGTYSGTLDDGDFSECTIDPLGALTVSYGATGDDLTSLSVTVYELDEAEGGTTAFEVSAGVGETGEGPYLSPYYGTGSGTATVTLADNSAEVHVTGETPDGEPLELSLTCQPLEDQRQP